MLNSEATRTPFRIKCNTLADKIIGQWLNSNFKLECRIKPAFDNSIIMLEICPAFIVTDSNTNVELCRFQTETTFSFSGAHSKAYIRGCIYYLTCLAIDEFNEALKRTSSILVIHKKFEKPAIDEIEPYVNDALRIDLPKKSGVIPHWKNIPKNTVEENNEIIRSLPPIPKEKHFLDGNTTLERIAAVQCFNKETLNDDSLKIIQKTIGFYKNCFAHLKRIDLRILTDSQSNQLKDYLNNVLNIFPIINNEITSELIYRVTIVRDTFLENDKLRNSRYLSYPPLNIIKENGIYNRANSPHSTVFYASIYPYVALRETHPNTGQRIVISTWQNKSNTPLNAFPICLTSGINNEYADRTNYAFEELTKILHPTISEWMECFFSFLSWEFIKESEPSSPKRYDYFFSAFVSDMLLQPFPENSKIPSFDCIVYPSVAWDHIHDNLAIKPDIIDKGIYTLVEAKEYKVLETWYGKEITLNQYPAELRQLRNSVGLLNNNIIWNDD